MNNQLWLRPLSFLFIFALFSACATTYQQRYAQLTSKSALSCAPNLSAAALLPAKKITKGAATEGELDDEHCLTLPDGMRSSYEVYEFTPTAASHSLEIITYIKPRGFGFGGENTIAVAQITLFHNGAPIRGQVQKKPVVWETTLIDGSMLNSTFLLSGLAVNKPYRVVVTTDNRNLGKEIPGYFSTVAAGVVVIGPLGKTKVTLQ